MEPGRELDIAVAEIVMGYKRIRVKDSLNPWTSYPDLEEFREIDKWKLGIEELRYPDPYSTEIKSAWKVVEKLNSIDKGVKIICSLYDYEVHITGLLGANYRSPSVCHSICVAALLSFGVKLWTKTS